ncbi:tetratricopeptide repeat protein [Candidatus Sulfurimonas baltica]|uniref:Nephrocystin 3-like N-terminal domain-containing protein n=1 Tax=Candidatus Sulfurimonas baltica TaxID=2740404 RepID=A0A7S7LSY5_9BACT|nr:hypothetical protein [Candidatus Sulfurimonas baltica]QOY50957.1 hypothetical protein HUE88_07310 [Candidatus Sulfurimonas baltica]
MQKCPECGGEIKENEKFYECIDNEDCGYRINKVKFQKQSQHWLETTIEDESLWNKPIFGTDIPIISAEYKRLYELCENKQSFGMLLEIKDIFEILIKLPTLLTASAIYIKSSFSEVESKLLIAMLEKQLSLGTWESIARSSQELNIDNPIENWLTNIIQVFKDGRITQWRNEEIGHGALSLDETDVFQEDIKSKLSILKKFFEENISTLIMLKEPVYQELMESIYFEKDTNNNIHFFDSYGYGKTSRVDYRNGTYSKKIESQFTSLSNSLSISQSTNRLDGCADGGVREAVVQKMFEELHKVDDYETPTYLVDWLKTNMNNHKKGLFLLQMQRGMGKSMFSRALDQLSLTKIKIPNTLVRAYYINDVYSYKLDEFTSVVDRQILNKQLLDKRIEDKIVGSAIPKSLDSKSQAKDLTNMLHEYKKVYGEENILFIIDGLDEIPVTQEKSILGILPSDDDLPEGVFILFTSRVKLSQKIQTKLDSISFTDKKSVLKDDADYISNTNKYIRKYIKLDLDDTTLVFIKERSDSRYVYIKLIKELVKTIGLEIEDIPNADKIIELYLSNLKAKYGDKFFTNITNLLAVVSTQYEPLTLQEIAYMLQDECISFKLLAWINDTRGFFRFERSYRGNIISIEHADIKSYLTKDKSVLDAMNYILSILVENITNEKHTIDLQIDGESYLLSHIWDYAKNKDTNNKLKNLIFIGSVLDSLENVEKQDKLLLNRSIKIYSQLIIIMQKLNQDENSHLDRNYLAGAFMNRGITNESLGKPTEALNDYDRAIEIMMILEQDETIHFDKSNLAKAFMNRGNTNKSLGKVTEALDDYDRAIEIMMILEQDETIHFDKIDLAKAFINRGNANDFLGNPTEALEDYDRVIEIRERLNKGETIHFDKNYLALFFMNRGNVNASLGKPTEALNDYDRAIEIMMILEQDETIHFDKSNLALAFLSRGTGHYSLGKLTEALNDYDRAIEIMMILDQDETIYFDKIDLAKAFMNRGIANESLGKPTEALNDYDRAIEIMMILEQDETIHFDKSYLAKAFMKRGDANASLAKYTKSLDDYSDFIEIIQILGQSESIHFDRKDIALVFMNRGYANASLEKPTKALADYDRAIEIMMILEQDETIYFDKSNLAKAYINRADTNHVLEKPTEELDDYDKAIEIRENLDKEKIIYFDKNDLASAYIDRGVFYHSRDDTLKRNQDFDKFFNIVVELIYFHFESGNTEKAIQIFQKNYQNIDMMLDNNMLRNQENIQRYKALSEE